MDNLLLEIRRRGFKLNNPIPIDSKLPCYEIVAGGANFRDPDAIIIEETVNVNAENIVRAFVDGSVKVENRKDVSQ